MPQKNIGEEDLSLLTLGDESPHLNIWRAYTTGLPSSVSVVGCALKMAVSVYQICKTKAEI